MKKITERNHNYTCCKKIVDKNWAGITSRRICGKPATHQDGNRKLCNHHSNTGQYVIRVGEVGEILSRWDTEQQARNEFAGLKMTGIQIQRLHNCKRTTLPNARK